MANRNFHQLQRLISLLDDSRNDIYILIDKTSKEARTHLTSKKSGLFILKEIPIYWGSYSQIKAELLLFSNAALKQYTYYHLLSGLDLPLTSQNNIHHFFDKHSNCQFVSYSCMSDKLSLSMRKRKHIFQKSFRISRKNPLYLLFKGIRKIETKYLEKTTHQLDDIRFGSNWVTLSDEFVQKIVKKENIVDVYHQFSHGYLVDELFIPYELKKFKMQNTVYHQDPVHDIEDEFQGNLRYINWWDGSPLIWTSKNFHELEKAKQAGHFFSRKFDETVDATIIDLVIKELINENTMKSNIKLKQTANF
ncbi:beta-1,6-N-acetylglucosaminyltransferase [Lactiplantibacillus xiangfangensis]|uniref:beta-1,6-N-acetylglucosaminyltransferase n=1 Tax=Lactiplantibacillus xiangfangensis TaxID=942150 RepID=UPI0023566154|nr:beta-1,6-N-acetylglucosaminyltransferase [Lactiplantibacillus xiangfangensis]